MPVGKPPRGFLGYGKCPRCHQDARVVAEDLSFSHAFGTQYEWAPITECCGEPIDGWEKFIAPLIMED